MKEYSIIVKSEEEKQYIIDAESKEEAIINAIEFYTNDDKDSEPDVIRIEVEADENTEDFE